MACMSASWPAAPVKRADSSNLALMMVTVPSSEVYLRIAPSCWPSGIWESTAKRLGSPAAQVRERPSPPPGRISVSSPFSWYDSSGCRPIE